MQKRPTEPQCYNIIKWTVHYLQDYGMHENSLFRESKSQHDIRSLKLQICEGRSRRQLGDLDCHVVGGVLVSALKDMPNALLFEIQENLLEAADGTDECLDRIAAYLSQLPPVKIEVLRVLFSYLHDLAAAPANDANVAHLMIIFAPLFCRPAHTAHMSIRHVDMLRQVRPLLQMTLENNSYIMSRVVANPAPVAPDKQKSAGASGGLRNYSGGDLKQSKQQGSKGLNLSISIGHNSLHKSEAKSAEVSSSPPHSATRGGSSDFPPKLNLGTSMDVDTDSSSSSSSSSGGDMTSHNFAGGVSGFFPPHGSCGASFNSHSWEWKLLDSLVMSRVEALVHKSDLVAVWDSSSRAADRKSSKADVARRQQGSSTRSSSVVAPVTAARDDDSSRMEEGEEEDSEEEDCVGALASGAHHQRARDRRAMMSECKQLRHDIQRFEEQFMSEHKRSPKPSERGSLQHSYTRYKDIKKEIRDAAAVYIQRVVRGCLCRRGQLSSGPMEMDQAQQEYVQQSQFSHLQQKRPASADGYHSQSNASSPLAKALAGVGGDVSLSTSLPLTRCSSDDGASTSSSTSAGMLEADSKASSSGALPAPGGMKHSLHTAWQDASRDDDAPSTTKSLEKASGSKQSGGGSGDSRSASGEKCGDEVSALCSRYHESLESKKMLKKLLKKFDDDFVLKKGRAPKKADKEVMRPQYQRYHEVRGELEKLKTEIVQLLGYFPKELEESKPAGGDEAGSAAKTTADHALTKESQHQSGARHGSSVSSTDASSSRGAGAGGSMEDAEGDDDDDHISGTSISSGHHGQQVAGQSGGGEASRAGGGDTQSPGGLDALNHEKKHLHLYLKSFEKEFNNANGRHVMHPEDILPVAKEYQRYRELKRILKDVRSAAPSSST